MLFSWSNNIDTRPKTLNFHSVYRCYPKNLGAPRKRHNLDVSYTQMPKNITWEIIVVLVKLELVGKKYVQLEQQ